jgi:hypothetical protein
MNRKSFRIARPLAMLGAIGATLIGLSAGGGKALAGETHRHEAWNWSGTLAAGQRLEINGVNGEIVAEPGTGDRVEILADKHGRRDDPANVRIKVNQDSHGITICAIYPGKSTPCEKVHLNFSLSDRANDVEVNFRVKVPAGVAFVANNENGAVRAHGLAGPIKAHTVNGECELETAGNCEASTVNGSVHASIGRLAPHDDLAFSTVNGSVTLALPAAADANVSCSTVNGDVRSDFPATTSGRWGPHRAGATLGRGGAKVSASTVNGSIWLQRVSAQ